MQHAPRHLADRVRDRRVLGDRGQGAGTAVRLVEDGNMLAANLEFLLKNPDERERMIQAAQDTVRDMRGALDRTIDVLDSYVFPLTVKRKLEDIGNGG